MKKKNGLFIVLPPDIAIKAILKAAKSIKLNKRVIKNGYIGTLQD